MSKVLILSNFGMGLYKFRKELLKELIDQGHNVYVSLPDDDYIPLLKSMGCNYIESNLDRRGKNPISDIRLMLSYIRMIHNIKPDIVLTYTIKPNIYGGMACRFTNTPYLPNITGLGTAIENQGMMQKLTLSLYKMGLKKADSVFFQNKSNKEFFCEKEILKSAPIVIPGSGVNLEEHQIEEYPLEDNTIRLLYIGRIMKNKGIDELLDASRRFKDNNKLEFHIVGFCEENYLKELEELDDEGVIHYHGQQNDVHKFIKDAHATILPSYHEGLSNVLLESASAGRPVLASNVDGCKETFDEGISGFGFDVKSTESLVETIKTFINLPYEKKKDMGAAGRKKIETEFDRNIVIQSYLKQIKITKENVK
ncbi:galacturonosyltransferase [Alkalibacterium subtropicum]|uniref:Galacturonosyltransferase n=1 Tax=Alkalibacterium subtropicum TaxID=753702 RepID=A0A1I1GHM0_9LACT|nr:glycosyltransferase family 4 protein [Alkalibacterium subtropicum]SFC10762.1 galacturonosyltransferase [Alkalibacterium subtropicum]